MRGGPPPLRFLLLVIGGWVAVRTAMLSPGWWTPPLGAAPAERKATPPRTRPEAPPARAAIVVHAPAAFAERRRPLQPVESSSPAPEPAPLLLAAAPALPPPREAAPEPTPVALLLPPPVPGRSRWSASVWLHLRRGGGGAGAIGPGGTLGGSQAGLRVNRRIADGVAVSARAYLPLGAPEAAEAALGIDWQPLPDLPVHLLVERRQALGEEGRSAFSATLYGGVHDAPLPGGFRLHAYAQAGIVGLRARDPFAEGAARIVLPLGGGVEAGAGAWAAVQPGAARVDAGPHLSVRLPGGPSGPRLAAEWRFRLAGDAAPASGPALTLAADF